MASIRSRVVVYHAADCSLCGPALEAVADVCGTRFESARVAALRFAPARYRESIPVVEIDGERAFTYFVRPEALRERLR